MIENNEPENIKPKNKKTFKKLAVGTILFGFSSLSLMYYIGTQPLLDIDKDDASWKKFIYPKINQISLFAEDKLNFTQYNWKPEGNAKENMSNLGVMATNGKWTVYRTGGDIYRLKTGKELSESKAIANDFAYHLNATKEGIFYEGVNDGKLYFIDYYGENKRAVVEDEVSYVTVVGEWIYYTNFSDNTNLYKVKFDGSQKQKVLDGSVMGFIIDDNYVYYSNFADDSKLYKAKLDGSENTPLNDQSSWRIFVTDNYIYYQNSPGYEGELYRISKDGGTPEKLINKQVDTFVVIDDETIYYSTHVEEKEPGFYKYSISNKNDKKISDKIYMEHSFYGNIITMKELGGNTKSYFDIKKEKFISHDEL